MGERSLAALAAALELAAAGYAAGAQGCPMAEVIAPGKGETIAASRPTIEWRALAGVERYRVQIESRIPEGRMLGRIDTVVADQVCATGCAYGRTRGGEGPGDGGMRCRGAAERD